MSADERMQDRPEPEEPTNYLERMAEELDRWFAERCESYSSPTSRLQAEERDGGGAREESTAEVEVRFVPRRKVEAESEPAEPLPEIDPEGYVLDTDHMGWVILPRHVHQQLEVIRRALRSDTWGEFLDRLPEGEREDMIARIEDRAGPDIVPWSEEQLREMEEERELLGEDWDEEVYLQEHICRGSFFDAEFVPGYMDGDWPAWPAEVDFVEYETDGICLLAYERYGKREAGFIHTSYHIEEGRIDEAEAWLRSIGARVERV